MSVRIRKTPELDLDRPIYRIFPLWFFEQALTLRSLALIPPKNWDDPYEDMAVHFQMADQAGGRQQSLAPYLCPAYAQCWSYEDNSDILIRAYSRVSIDPIIGRNKCPADEGVRVKTTPRKLIDAVNSAAENHRNFEFFIGRVSYGTNDQISQLVVNMLAQCGANQIGRGERRANTLFLKGQHFRHEAEVRLIAIAKNRDTRPDLLRLSLDPNQVFEAVEFDHRLRLFERREREASARNLGFSGQFTGEEKASGRIFLVPLEGGWDELEKGSD